MRCSACGASVIAGSARCYRCETPLAFEERPVSVAASRAPPPPAPAPRPKRPWAAVGFGALAALFVLDVLVLDDAPALLVAALAFGALGWLAFGGRAQRLCIGVSGAGVVLGLMAAAGGGILVGPLTALASGATLAALLVRVPAGTSFTKTRLRAT